MTHGAWTESSITIGKREISTRTGMMSQADLRFYEENPRVYSLIRRTHVSPSQRDIEELLQDMDHVKQLIQSIRANGGLIDPLIVRDGDHVVLEGNSRLAAYRALAQLDPIAWGQCKVTLLPTGIDERHVFALLGEYHIVGKKDWQPYEQAGYLYRRIEHHGASATEIASEMGLATRKVNSLVEVYRFMVEHNEEDVNRWSYYEEYLRPRVTKTARASHPDLDAIVVAKIRAGEIKKAIDVREKLIKVLKGGERSINIFKSGPNTLERALIRAAERGVDNPWLGRLETFRRQLVAQTTRDEFKEMRSQHKNRARFEVNKIEAQIKRLKPLLET